MTNKNLRVFVDKLESGGLDSGIAFIGLKIGAKLCAARRLKLIAHLADLTGQRAELVEIAYGDEAEVRKHLGLADHKLVVLKGRRPGSLSARAVVCAFKERIAVRQEIVKRLAELLGQSVEEVEAAEAAKAAEVAKAAKMAESAEV